MNLRPRPSRSSWTVHRKGGGGGGGALTVMASLRKPSARNAAKPPSAARMVCCTSLAFALMRRYFSSAGWARMLPRILARPAEYCSTVRSPFLSSNARARRRRPSSAVDLCSVRPPGSGPGKESDGLVALGWPRSDGGALLKLGAWSWHRPGAGVRGSSWPPFRRSN